MAAPTITARSTPGGIALQDGFSTLITFTVDPDISFWEKTVKPPGIDNRDPIDTSTMHNTSVVTKAARALNELTSGSTKVAYDPNVYTQILAICGTEGSINVMFPDGSTLSFYGHLRSFEADDIVEGEQPEATVAFEVTNWDPVNRVEVSPVMTSVAGT